MCSGAARSCSDCHEPRAGLFCEVCGQRHGEPASSASPWCAVVAPDQEYFAAGGADVQRFTFPADPAQQVPLRTAVVRIGRRSRSGRSAPEIELADPGVSRKHARLLAEPDGTWTVVDDGSTNGTYVNGARQRIPAHQHVPLADGDHLNVGVWTRITLLGDPAPTSARR